VRFRVSRPVLPFVRPSSPQVVLATLLLGALGVYGFFAARHVGGCDTWAYLSDSLVLRGKDVGLTGTLDPARFPATTPLCYDLIGRKLVSHMPAGFPVLLALGGLLNGEYWVSPLLGILSVALLYDSIRRRCGPWIGVAFAAVWATSPIVVWGSTQLMSDMAAATFALLTFVLVERARGLAAGAALGFSVGIRPTNVLLLPTLVISRPRSRDLLRFGAGFALALLYWVAFALGRYERPFPTGYAANVHEFSPEHVAYQLGFFARTTFSMFWPILPLSVFGLYRQPRLGLPLALWFLSYISFYSFWKYPFSEWWWTRYLLPAYPSLLILAAHGAVEFYRVLRDRLGLGATAARAIGSSFVLATCAASVLSGLHHNLFMRGYEEPYERDSRRIAQIVPPNSLIGAMNFTGPLRLYAGLESFSYDHPEAPELIDWAFESARPVYAVIEPAELDTNPSVRLLRERFDLKDVAPLSNGVGLMLKRIVPRGGGDGVGAGGRLDLVLGTPPARRFLVSGWSGDEFDEKASWTWSTGRQSVLQVPLEAGRDVALTIVLAPFVLPGRSQVVQIVVNEAALTTLELVPGFESRTVYLPGRVVRRSNRIELRYAYAVSPKQLGISQDPRELGVSVQRISFQTLPAPNAFGAKVVPPAIP
jgi:hypothetical protein